MPSWVACSSPCEIRVLGWLQLISNGCSRRSTRRSQAVWGWGCRSAVRSSKRGADDCGQARTFPAAPSFNSLSLPIQILRSDRRAGALRLSIAAFIFATYSNEWLGRAGKTISISSDRRPQDACRSADRHKTLTRRSRLLQFPSGPMPAWTCAAECEAILEVIALTHGEVVKNDVSVQTELEGDYRAADRRNNGASSLGVAA
ncbi:hypothetical protein MES5069_680026 [Mesorhizobium escarrei]|uniref:Uncharacterized protein n=1 Tax=Mesorhizobium escarrei TaxID=666018 RepID=A0ABN8KFN9_9HYPH|nr:hypothetical protein MES5069_680026 [Mesorhizobium escarrei]